MCPEYYQTATRRPNEVSLSLCRANNMESITPENVATVCRNNCMSCYLYQNKNARKPPERVQQEYDEMNAKQSGGCGIYLILAVVLIIFLKVAGIV